MTEKMLTEKEAAKLLGVTVEEVRGLMRTGQLEIAEVKQGVGPVYRSRDVRMAKLLKAVPNGVDPAFAVLLATLQVFMQMVNELEDRVEKLEKGG